DHVGIARRVDELGGAFARGNAAREEFLDGYAALGDRVVTLVGNAETASPEHSDDTIASDLYSCGKSLRFAVHLAAGTSLRAYPNLRENRKIALVRWYCLRWQTRGWDLTSPIQTSILTCDLRDT